MTISIALIFMTVLFIGESFDYFFFFLSGLCLVAVKDSPSIARF